MGSPKSVENSIHQYFKDPFYLQLVATVLHGSKVELFPEVGNKGPSLFLRSVLTGLAYRIVSSLGLLEWENPDYDDEGAMQGKMISVDADDQLSMREMPAIEGILVSATVGQYLQALQAGEDKDTNIELKRSIFYSMSIAPALVYCSDEISDSFHTAILANQLRPHNLVIGLLLEDLDAEELTDAAKSEAAFVGYLRAPESYTIPNQKEKTARCRALLHRVRTTVEEAVGII